MKSLDPDPLHSSPTLEGASVAVLGYDAGARDHALALRRAGNKVTIGVPPDTTCWSRAVSDGFAVDQPATVVAGADVVVVLVHDHEETWRQSEAHVPAGALVVFGCAASPRVRRVCARWTRRRARHHRRRRAHRLPRRRPPRLALASTE